MTSDEIRGFIAAMKLVNGKKDFKIFFTMRSYDSKKVPGPCDIVFMALGITFVHEMFQGVMESESNRMYGAFRCADVISMTTDNPKGLL